jgi:hypothetical protein
VWNWSRFRTLEHAQELAMVFLSLSDETYLSWIRFLAWSFRVVERKARWLTAE